MFYPITIRLWLTEVRADEAEELIKRRQLLKPKLNQQSGKYYVDISGHDAFAVAGMVPRELIQLVTVRQEIDPKALAEQSRDQGMYVHDGVEIISEVGRVPYSMGKCGFESRELFATGDEIAKLRQAYNLFREGKLTKCSWKKIEEVDEKMPVQVQCGCCSRDVNATREAIKTEHLTSGGTRYYVVCPACESKNTISFSGEGTEILQK